MKPHGHTHGRASAVRLSAASGAAPAVPSAARLAGLARDRFPVLRRRVHGRPLIYLDSAATSQKPEAVIRAEARYYRRHNANVHRGLHALADEATQAYEECRARVARWLDAEAPEAVVIARNATAALNLVARGLEHRLEAGDEILLTEMEHHANLVPWLMLAERIGVKVRYLPVTEQGELDLSRLAERLTHRTRVVSFCHVSNVLGTINPVAELSAAAHSVGAVAVVDAAQAVGHMPVSLAASGADLLVFSAHKCYGPMGLGFLVGRPELLERMEPSEGGGEMIETVLWDRATWADVPHKFEAGTPNVAGAAAFIPAMDLLQEIGLESVREHERELVRYAWRRLMRLGGLTLFGPAGSERRGGLISFHDPQVHPHDLATILDRHGVAIRAGHHCAQPLHRRLGVVATARASFGMYSDQDDVDALIEALRAAREVMAG